MFLVPLKSQLVADVLQITKYPGHMREMCAMFVHNIPMAVESPFYHPVEFLIVQDVTAQGCVLDGMVYNAEYFNVGCECFVFRIYEESPRYAVVEPWVSTLFDNLPLPDCLLNIVYKFATHRHGRGKTSETLTNF